jgi:hypothetical protein
MTQEQIDELAKNKVEIIMGYGEYEETWSPFDKKIFKEMIQSFKAGYAAAPAYEKNWIRPNLLEIIKNMRDKNFREEIILEEVEKEINRQIKAGYAAAPAYENIDWDDVIDMVVDYYSTIEQRNVFIERLKAKSPTQPNSVQEGDGWISIEDRLPDNFNWCNDSILFVSKNGTIRMGSYDYEDGFWHQHSDGGTFIDITHWQPLPAPPQQ